jgi:hypothetical protein
MAAHITIPIREIRRPRREKPSFEREFPRIFLKKPFFIYAPFPYIGKTKGLFTQKTDAPREQDSFANTIPPNPGGLPQIVLRTPKKPLNHSTGLLHSCPDFICFLSQAP